MDEKKCSKCSEIKLLSEFSKQKSSKSGYKYNCKSCDKDYRVANKDKNTEYQKKWYIENRDRILEGMQDNREHILEYKRKRYQEKREILSAISLEYYHKNRDHCNLTNKKWRQENHEIRRAIEAKRRALKKSVSTTDPWELQQISLFYKECPEGYHVDHIIPLAKGGRHELSNLQHLEDWMNQNKFTKHPDDWDDPRQISCRA